MKFQDFEVAVAELPEELDEDPLEDEPELDEPEDELPLDDEPELEDPLDDEPELEDPLDEDPELDEPPIVCSVTFKLLFVANVVV